jgi:hypothetical protein
MKRMIPSLMNGGFLVLKCFGPFVIYVTLGLMVKCVARLFFLPRCCWLVISVTMHATRSFEDDDTPAHTVLHCARHNIDILDIPDNTQHFHTYCVASGCFKPKSSTNQIESPHSFPFIGRIPYTDRQKPSRTKTDQLFTFERLLTLSMGLGCRRRTMA